MEKRIYNAPEVEITRIKSDIITFSETEEWTGPVVGEGLFGGPQTP